MKETFMKNGPRIEGQSPGWTSWLFLPVFLILSACSCSTEGGLQQILGTSAEAPVFLDCRPVSSTELVFRFSSPVRVVSLHFDSPVETESVEEGREVKITFARPPEEGIKIVADILVEDPDRNTLNVIVPFRARNERIPALVFNEIRTEYTKPKVEFIEFFALEAGNLGALRLFVAGHSLSKPVYEFAPVEVKARDYIVLHLRTVEEGCVDETGQDLALSNGTEAPKDVRDLWLPGSAKLLHKTDALWLMDQDDRIIDAVLLCENPKEWGKNNSAAAAEFLGRNGAWLPPTASGTAADGAEGEEGTFIPDYASAVNTAGTTLTRTICRDENLPPRPRIDNWYITANSGATPGKPNSVKRYQ